jgi:glycosyltransferase involved in cell wall biosynthesis
VPAEKIFNVGCGVDPAYRPGGGVYGLPFSYVLCVSNRKRHKNEVRVVEAFAGSGLASKKKLVFTGKPTAELANLIERNRVTHRVHFAGVVQEERLPSLYRGADALIFPSLYEGFGLPLLEAMACGTPALTSNITAMPEVAAGAALLVDPTSVEEIAAAMHRIVSDMPLRQQLREKGLERAAQFSWAITAGMVHKLLAGNAGK